MKQLLALLAEISPESATMVIENLDFSEHANKNGGLPYGPLGIDDMKQDMQKKLYADLAEPPPGNMGGGGANNRTTPRNDPVQRKGTPARNSFFVHLASPQLSNNSKWLEDDPVIMLQLPFIESPIMVDGNFPTATTTIAKSKPQHVHSSHKLAPSLISLNCVVPKMRFEDCAAAQRYCLAHLSSLRHTMATSSFDGCQYMEGAKRKETVPYLPPLEIVSAAIVKVCVLYDHSIVQALYRLPFD